MKPIQSATLTEIKMNSFLLLILVGCSDGRKLKAAFRQTADSIDDYVAYSKCLGRCAVDVGCSGVSTDSDGLCHLVYGVTSDSTSLSVLEVKHAQL